MAAGTNLTDLAPRYGEGKAERVVGEATGLVPERSITPGRQAEHAPSSHGRRRK
jgi:hypothetical protein